MGDARHIRRAIELASSQHTHPNPRVGAILVDETGSVVGEGAHIGPGNPHAEVVALDRAGAKARGSTLYVTLEPCSHHGLTPPCVDAIVSAGVARVVVGAIDPDPRVSGSGVSRLRDAGLEVVTDVVADEAVAVDPAYFHHRRTGLPLVTLKSAMTLDGSVAAVDGTSQWISSEEARHDAHLLRATMDAVVIGAGTLRNDDPLLTARLRDGSEHQPVPVIVAGTQELPTDSRIWERSPVVFGATAMDVPSGEVIVVASEHGLPDPEAVARALAERGHLDVLLEGGPGLAGAWWRAGIVGRGVIYVAARVGGGRGISPLAGDFATMPQSREVNIRDVRMVGPDIRIEFD
ncbi:MAG: bifunctional diaminohydroxyphosphoribosylaminopyrimidine deaminase/5-amino-6-(5-phosphoribosylamino)uracil reductase RibD [Acidimicrobiia bacterium]